MSTPKNNLDDVLKRRASGSTVLETAASPSVSSSKPTSKFKPSTLKSRPSLSSSALPTFSTPGFGKPTASKSYGALASDPKPKPTANITNVVALGKRSMEAESSSSAGQSQKRIKSDTFSMKENVKQLPTPQSAKSLGKRREGSPLVTPSAAATLSSYAPAPVDENPFARLSMDFPALSGQSGQRDSSPVTPVRSSKYPDLLAKSPRSLKRLLTFNQRHKDETDRTISSNKPDVDVFTLDSMRNLLNERISAIKELLGPDISTIGSTPNKPIPVEEITSSRYFHLPNNHDRSDDISSSTASRVSYVDLSLEEDEIMDEPVPPSNHQDIQNDPGSDDDLWANVDDFDNDVLAIMDSEEFEIEEIKTPAVIIPEHLKKTPFYSEVMDKLKTVFKLEGFRENQLQAISATLEGKDVFVLMPTGGGKSLCFQLPAICQQGKTKGVSFVVSPLVALMEDQVQALVHKGMDVLLWNSETKDHMDIVRRIRGRPKPAMVYVTPEKLKESGLLRGLLSDLYRDKTLARFVIDEAHCISSWGKDFREAYSALSALRCDYPDVPIIALTATANRTTVDDIKSKLGLRNCVTLTMSFNRTNLNYMIQTKKPSTVLEEMARFIQDNHRNQSGVIYCRSRDKCEKVAEQLRAKGLKAKHYHALIDPEEKRSIQKEWQSNECDIIVATIAFGMGIDKPDVRFVIHHDLPKGLDGYYQETGRAGRDGLPADCLLYYSYGDFQSQVRMIKSDTAVPQVSIDRQIDELRKVVAYCVNDSDCRRTQVLQYFGENFDRKKCRKGCDVCREGAVMVEYDLTTESRKIIALVRHLEHRNVTSNHFQSVFYGSKKAEVVKTGDDQLEWHGAGSHLQLDVIEKLFMKLQLEQALAEVSVNSQGGWHNSYLKLGPHADYFEHAQNAIIIKHRQKAVPLRAKPATTKRTKSASTSARSGAAARPRKF